MAENRVPLPPPVQPNYIILDKTFDPARTDPLPPDQLQQLFTYGEHWMATLKQQWGFHQLQAQEISQLKSVIDMQKTLQESHKETVATIQDQLKEQHKIASDLLQEKDTATQELQQQQQIVKQLELQVKTTQDQLDALNLKVTEDTAKHTEALDALQEDLQAKTQKIEDLESQLTTEVAGLQKLLKTREATLQDQDTKLAASRQELALLQQSVAEHIPIGTVTQAKFDSLQAKYDTAKETINILKADLGQRTAAAEDLDNANTSLEERLENTIQLWDLLSDILPAPRSFSEYTAQRQPQFWLKWVELGGKYENPIQTDSLLEFWPQMELQHQALFCTLLYYKQLLLAQPEILFCITVQPMAYIYWDRYTQHGVASQHPELYNAWKHHLDDKSPMDLLLHPHSDITQLSPRFQANIDIYRQAANFLKNHLPRWSTEVLVLAQQVIQQNELPLAQILLQFHLAYLHLKELSEDDSPRWQKWKPMPVAGLISLQQWLHLSAKLQLPEMKDLDNIRALHLKNQVNTASTKYTVLGAHRYLTVTDGYWRMPFFMDKLVQEHWNATPEHIRIDPMFDPRFLRRQEWTTSMFLGHHTNWVYIPNAAGWANKDNTTRALHHFAAHATQSPDPDVYQQGVYCLALAYLIEAMDTKTPLLHFNPNADLSNWGIEHYFMSLCRDVPAIVHELFEDMLRTGFLIGTDRNLAAISEEGDNARFLSCYSKSRKKPHTDPAYAQKLKPEDWPPKEVVPKFLTARGLAFTGGGVNIEGLSMLYRGCPKVGQSSKGGGQGSKK